MENVHYWLGILTIPLLLKALSVLRRRVRIQLLSAEEADALSSARSPRRKAGEAGSPAAQAAPSPAPAPACGAASEARDASGEAVSSGGDAGSPGRVHVFEEHRRARLAQSPGEEADPEGSAVPPALPEDGSDGAEELDAADESGWDEDAHVCRTQCEWCRANLGPNRCCYDA